MGDGHPVEYQEGSRRAREARSHVAHQLGHLIEAADLTGCHPLIGRRISGYANALKTSDELVIRSALMDLGIAVGTTVAALDLDHPHSEAVPH